MAEQRDMPRVQQAAQAFDVEHERIRVRREQTGLDPITESRGHWGLAFSGGGIRSATVSLGVLQSLSLADAPPGADGTAAPEPDASLLREFDYVSSVSGGGYIASFFISLFVPGRLKQQSQPRDAASDAYEVLRYEPPGRMRSNEDLSGAHIGQGPMSWLRENGRYLTPTGGGDTMYAAALTIRNWFAVQYVLGTLLITTLALLALLRAGMALHWNGYRAIEYVLLDGALNDGKIWWSPIWGMAAAWFLLWVVPCGTAFWLTHPREGGSDADRPQPFSLAATCTLLIGLLLFALTALVATTNLGHWRLLPWLIGAMGLVATLAFVFHAATVRKGATIAAQRVYSTRALTSGLLFLVTVSTIALADTLGQHLYLWATTRDEWWAQLTPGALMGALVWLFRRIASFFDEKQASGWMKKVPTSLLLALAGVVLVLLVVTIWAVFVQWLQWTSDAPSLEHLASPQRVVVLCGAFLLFLILTLTGARFSGFLNLSTLQMLYGARLTRAYLGASNGRRFEKTASGFNRSVAEPIDGDQIGHERYYAPDVLAPVHIINVTLNQTIDPAEQLVQRDRKGKPMAIGPTGFFIEGDPFTFRDRSKESINSGKGSQRFTIGTWIGISGAAFTTGLGRSTSLGASLVLGLSNVRLGMWWSSGYGENRARGIERWFKAAFRTQMFLIYELLAKFHGLRREWQYLSDGGHYENTAAYELLREARRVKFMVVCDNGCDPQYQFGDLANLIRLARIDYRMEIEVDTAITQHDELQRYFGVPEDFSAAQTQRNEKCALLLNVYREADGKSGRTPDCRIVVLKPRLLDSMPVDVREYRLTHPDFPQEPTADQFFDEAQWESYRCVGYSIGRKIFGTRQDDEVGGALWEYFGRNK